MIQNLWNRQLFRRCDVGVVNIDDENTEALLEGHTCKLVTYGRSEKADYRAEGCAVYFHLQMLLQTDFREKSRL